MMKLILITCVFAVFATAVPVLKREIDDSAVTLENFGQILADSLTVASIRESAETLTDDQLDALIRIFKLETRTKDAANQVEAYVSETRRAGKAIDFKKVEEILEPAVSQLSSEEK